MDITFIEETNGIQTILRQAALSLTPATGSDSLNFCTPFKVKRGSNIVVNASTGVGNIICCGCIVGYLTEGSNS